MRTIRFGRHRRQAVGYALAGNVVPILIATLGGLGSHPPVFFAGAAIACLVPVLVTALPERHARIRMLLGLAGLPGLTMMLADSGGVASGYAILIMMAMIWFGLQADDRELTVMIAVLAVCAFGPMLVIGPPAYPVSVSHAILLLIVGTAVAGAVRTVTREMARLHARLREEATRDPLTGLLNRRGWEQAAGRELASAYRGEDTVILAAIDLDGFKALNDAHGHDEGDRTLREVAESFRDAIRGSDLIARFGGDEFVALFRGTTPTGAQAAVQRLRGAVTPGAVTFSIGLARAQNGESLEGLARRADLALYADKARTERGVKLTAPPPEALAGSAAAPEPVAAAGTPQLRLVGGPEPDAGSAA